MAGKMGRKAGNEGRGGRGTEKVAQKPPAQTELVGDHGSEEQKEIKEWEKQREKWVIAPRGLRRRTTTPSTDGTNTLPTIKGKCPEFYAMPNNLVFNILHTALGEKQFLLARQPIRS